MITTLFQFLLMQEKKNLKIFKFDLKNISSFEKNVDKNKILGTIQYFDSSVKVSISTKALPDRRLQLLTDEVSFTVDL